MDKELFCMTSAYSNTSSMQLFTRDWKLKTIAVITALVMNFSYIYLLNDALPKYGAAPDNIALAYNFCKYGTLCELTEKVDGTAQKMVSQGFYDTPIKPPIRDTVGYGFLVGMLWKITGSFDVFDVQLLQIVLFCLILFLLYEMFFLLFQSSAVAFGGCMVINFWYHLVHMNVTPSRDIWSYYGVIVLAYLLFIFFLSKSYNYKKLFFAASFFAFCQFLRPNLVGQCVTLCLALLLLFYMYKRESINNCFKAIGLVVFVNILFCWILFLKFNKITYDRYFVGCLGHSLVASLGVVDNPWGLKCTDDSVFTHMSKIHGSYEYSPGSNDRGMKEFFKLTKENTFIYVKALFKSLFDSFFYEVTTVFDFFYQSFTDSVFFKTKLHQALGLSNGLFFLKILEQVSLKVVRNVGYLGLALAIFRRRFIPIIYLMGGVFLGMWVLLISHFEQRYIIPFSLPFAVFAAYFLVDIGKYILQKMMVKKS